MLYTADFIAYCKRLSLTLTSLRKSVLCVLWEANKPLKAYDVLEILLLEQPNITAAAVYRALGFFVEAGVAHKIDSIQAYALCNKPDVAACSEILMVCSMCRDTRAVQNINVRDALAQLARLDAFELSHTPIELRGVCSICAQKQSK